MSSPLASGSVLYAAAAVRCTDGKIIEQLDSAALLLVIYEETYTKLDESEAQAKQNRVRLNRGQLVPR